ncbi:hypothetical protein AOLI_G00131270 [Acnodon oligacanthus]
MKRMDDEAQAEAIDQLIHIDLVETKTYDDRSLGSQESIPAVIGQKAGYTLDRAGEQLLTMRNTEGKTRIISELLEILLEELQISSVQPLRE